VRFSSSFFDLLLAVLSVCKLSLASRLDFSEPESSGITRIDTLFVLNSLVTSEIVDLLFHPASSKVIPAK
jgi:hypothetical protein